MLIWKNYKIKRFYTRLKFLFRVKEIFNWCCESCNNCGVNYRLVYSIPDELWLKINNKTTGCLCFDCLVQKAQDKNIIINKRDIEYLWIFDPENKSIDLINNKL